MTRHSTTTLIMKGIKFVDLKIAISVLKDFGITATISDIPDVKSVYELEKWKARLIKDRLDSEDK